MTDEPHPYRTNDRRVIPGLLFGLVAIFGALYVAGYYVTSDRIPRGTTVDGIALGGMTPTVAQRTLRDGIEAGAYDVYGTTSTGPGGADARDDHVSSTGPT